MTDVLERPQAAPVEMAAPERGSRRRPEAGPGGRALLASLSLAAGGIHLALVPSHWGEWAVEGLVFAIVGWVQVALAVLLWRRATRPVLVTTALVNAAAIGAWAFSRAWGLPFGPHAWHPENATFVDLTCVALEAVLVVLAIAWTLRRPSHGAARAGRAGLVTGFIASFAVLALATAALASPSARNHSHAEHGDHGVAADGHVHGATTGDDKGLALLTNGHQHGHGEVAVSPATQTALTAQLTQSTLPLVEKYPTVAQAEAAGYRRAGPYRPGLGTHYVGLGNRSMADDQLQTKDGTLYPVLIYDGSKPTSPLAGFMYLALGAKGIPGGFVGPNDHWHYHSDVCVVYQQDGRFDAPLGSDSPALTQKQCDRYHGRLMAKTPYMVHVWTVPGYESLAGVFSEINPKLTCPNGTYYERPIDTWGYRLSTCKDV